jgi:sugar phosphate permease
VGRPLSDDGDRNLPGGDRQHASPDGHRRHHRQPGPRLFSDSLFKTRKGVIMTGLTGMTLVLILLACLPRGTDLTVLSPLFFAFGFFTSACQVMYAHIKVRVTIERAGTAMTGVNFFTMVGFAVYLQGLGSLMQYLYQGESLSAPAFQAAFFFCAACLALAVVLYGFAVETRGKSKTVAGQG